MLAEGFTSDVRTMEGQIRSGAPGFGAGKTLPYEHFRRKSVSCEGIRSWRSLPRNMRRTNRCGGRALVVTLACTIGGMYPLPDYLSVNSILLYIVYHYSNVLIAVTAVNIFSVVWLYTTQFHFVYVLFVNEYIFERYKCLNYSLNYKCGTFSIRRLVVTT